MDVKFSQISQGILMIVDFYKFVSASCCCCFEFLLFCLFRSLLFLLAAFHIRWLMALCCYAYDLELMFVGGVYWLGPQGNRMGRYLEVSLGHPSKCRFLSLFFSGLVNFSSEGSFYHRPGGRECMCEWKRVDSGISAWLRAWDDVKVSIQNANLMHFPVSTSPWAMPDP